MAQVSITDNQRNIRFDMTNPFDFYKFDTLDAGSSYIIQVFDTKQHQFSNPIRIITIDENFTNLNFIADN